MLNQCLTTFRCAIQTLLIILYVCNQLKMTKMTETNGWRKKRWERKPIKIGNNRFTISCKFFSIVTYYSTTVVYLLCHSRQYRQYRLFFSTIVSVSSLDFSNSFNSQRYFHDFMLIHFIQFHIIFPR